MPGRSGAGVREKHRVPKTPSDARSGLFPVARVKAGFRATNHDQNARVSVEVRDNGKGLDGVDSSEIWRGVAELVHGFSVPTWKTSITVL